LWPRATVPYDIAEDLPSPERVSEAIAHWQEKTPIRFIERTPENRFLYPNWVTFRPGYGCTSHVGCRGGQQFVTLGMECKTGNVIHEIGHVVGLFHEQSREDRDNYIDIVFDNIPEYYRHNFRQHIKDGDDFGLYDYGSIMHYSQNAFSVDGSDTIIPKNGAVIGQREGLSDGDIATVKAMYECV
jgi:astacin